eukprot:17675-Eustigmatos_ZCMA.PRE.1
MLLAGKLNNYSNYRKRSWKSVVEEAITDLRKEVETFKEKAEVVREKMDEGINEEGVDEEGLDDWVQNDQDETAAQTYHGPRM